MSAHHPFQLLAYVRPASSLYIVAACGPTLSIASVTEGGGNVISHWSSGDKRQEPNNGHDNGEPNSKKRKLQDDSSSGPDIIKLIVSSDERHVLAVTGTDKCIRVFWVSDDGILSELSQRIMPKRTCAIAITPDGKTIICGDKFGDVYSLPLLPSAEPNAVNQSTDQTPQPKMYKPSASELTVHTKRNRRALEEQMRAAGNPVNAKEAITFEHELLLGHVSMLTDMQLAASDVDGQRRPFIITSDRDEHIRVSRGIPQAHIIETFCLGHTEFVHKLRVIKGTSKDLLVSGGGDDWIGVWNWRAGKLLGKKDIRSISSKPQSDSESPAKLAVEHIWQVCGLEILGSGPPARVVDLVAVQCEGHESLAVFEVDTLADETATASIVDCSTVGEILAAVEHCKGKFPISTDREQRLQWVQIERVGGDGQWHLKAAEAAEDETARLAGLNSLDVARPDQAALASLLHGTEKLRKQDYEKEEEG